MTGPEITGPVTTGLVLASRSAGRRNMLGAAGLVFESAAADIDEAAIKRAMTREEAPPDAIALALAEAKALAIGRDDALVIGCDQILALDDGTLLGKPADRDDACRQLAMLSGTRHHLISAVALQRGGAIAWHHADRATLSVRSLSDGFIRDYVDRNWDDIRHSVGCYQIEGAGAQLFERVEGDYFTVIGLPLLPLLAQLREFGIMAS